ERKARMDELSTGFIVLPGGFGTLDEVFEILTWNQLGLIAKPVVFYNVADYFTPLMTALDHMIESGFVREKFRPMLRLATTSREAVDIATGPAPAVEGKLSDLDVTSKRSAL
ncbi:MAG: hypothetical protein RLZZ128_136, partial [Actinomycetota bacterium]